MADGCADCGAEKTQVVLDGTRLCHRCADRRIAAHTGWPELPDPPAAQVIVGPDGRTHTMQIRLHRAATGGVAMTRRVPRPHSREQPGSGRALLPCSRSRATGYKEAPG
jgi:hypothetical protein